MSEQDFRFFFFKYLPLSSLVLFFLGILFFYPNFSSYFRQDDFFLSTFLTPESKVKPGIIEKFFHPSAGKENGGDIFNRLRPFPVLAVLSEYLLWGINFFWFSFVNFLIHIALCILCILFSYFVFPQLLKPYSIVSGILFLLYPGHLETMCWVMAQQSGLCTLFTTSTLFCFLLTLLGKKTAYPFALASFVLALGSKEMAIMIPPLLLTLHILPLFSKNPPKRKAGSLLKLHAPFWILFALYLFYRYHLFGAFFGRVPSGKVSLQSLPAYVQTLIPSLVRFLAPINAELVSPALWWIGTVLCIGISLGFPLLAALLKRKRIDRRELFFLLWIFLVILPVIPVFHIKANLLESRQFYLPSVPLAILLPLALLTAGGFRSGNVHPAGKVSLLILILLYAAFLRPSVLSYQNVGKTTRKVQQRIMEVLQNEPPETGVILINLPFHIRGVHFAGAGFNKLISFPFTSRTVHLEYSLDKTNKTLQEMAHRIKGSFKAFLWDRKNQTVNPYAFEPGEEKKKLRLIRPPQSGVFPSFGPDFKFQFSYEGKCTHFRIKFSIEKIGQIFTVGEPNLRRISRTEKPAFEWSPAQGTLEDHDLQAAFPDLQGKTIRWQVEAIDGSEDPPVTIARSLRFTFSIKNPGKKGWDLSGKKAPLGKKKQRSEER